jgi:hypothetical protein
MTKKDNLMVRGLLIFAGMIIFFYIVYAFLLVLWQISIVSLIFFFIQIIRLARDKGLWLWELALAAGFNSVIDAVFGKVIAAEIKGMPGLVVGGVTSLIAGVLGLLLIIRFRDSIKQAIDDSISKLQIDS